MFGHARDLPAIVFAMKFVGEEIEFRLQVFQYLWTLNRARLPYLQLPLLDLGVEAHRLERPAALLQPLHGLVGVTLVREEKIMVKRLGAGQRFVQLFVRLRTFRTCSQQRSNTFKHDGFSIIQRTILPLIFHLAWLCSRASNKTAPRGRFQNAFAPSYNF